MNFDTFSRKYNIIVNKMGKKEKNKKKGKGAEKTAEKTQKKMKLKIKKATGEVRKKEILISSRIIRFKL